MELIIDREVKKVKETVLTVAFENTYGDDDYKLTPKVILKGSIKDDERMLRLLDGILSFVWFGFLVEKEDELFKPCFEDGFTEDELNEFKGHYEITDLLREYSGGEHLAPFLNYYLNKEKKDGYNYDFTKEDIKKLKEFIIESDSINYEDEYTRMSWMSYNLSYLDTDGKSYKCRISK